MTSQDVDQIFDSMDHDNSGTLSLPELQADFNDICRNSLEDILMEERHKRRVAEKINEAN